MNTFSTNFLNRQQAEALLAEHGSPLYIYNADVLREQARQCLSVDVPYGLTVRYAMKANPNTDVLRVVREAGLTIDASSGYEAEQALACGYAPQDILITSQELPKNLHQLVEQGVQFNACSLHQLETYGKLFPGGQVSVRFNPGIGVGGYHQVNVGGPAASFGIWHEYTPQVHELLNRYNLHLARLHTHGGCSWNESLWDKSTDATFRLLEQFPEAAIVNLGGGFKVARNEGEKTIDMQAVGKTLRRKLEDFATRTGRKLHLEIEPGMFVTANAGIILAQVEDIVDTGPEGYNFIKLNTGWTEILRPGLYASQHPIAILSDSDKYKDYAVVGHCCESGDLLTPDPSNPSQIATRRLPVPRIGDITLIGGCGAYCAAMAAHGYNSFPRAKEVLV